MHSNDSMLDAFDRVQQVVHRAYNGLSNEQVWTAAGWKDTFGLPFAAGAIGWSQTSDEVGQVTATADQLLGYYNAVQAATVKYLQALQPENFEQIVDPDWDPPVTLAIRLVSVLADDLQHVGQAGYIKGLQPEATT